MALQQRTTHAGYTWNDFVALADEDRRELIDGELVETEVPTSTHEEIVGWFVYWLRAWAEAGHGGTVLTSGYRVRVDDRRGVMPDVQFYRDGNRPGPDQEQGLVRGHIDLVVEVMSPSSRRVDRFNKLQWYAALGVREYWLVDPDSRTIEQFVLLDNGHYSVRGGGVGNEVFQPDTFPGLVAPLVKLWGEDAPRT